MLTGRLLPVHPKPLTDELLTSWIVRIAEANAVKLHTLTRFLFGDHKRSPWMRDIARSGPEWLVEKISEVTGTTRELANQTTLNSYYGKIFPAKQISGQLRWLLPAKIKSSNRLGHCLQYCPVCLAGDNPPYYRRRWRIGYYTFCTEHDVMLLDACPVCDSPIVIHRRDFSVDLNQARRMTECNVCGFDLQEAPKLFPEVLSRQVYKFHSRIVNPLERPDRWSDEYGLGFSAALHQLCKLMVMIPNKGSLRIFVENQLGVESQELPFGRFPFEQRRVVERHYVISLALWMLQSPRERFRAAWKAGAIRYNSFLKDFVDPPSWYVDIVEEFNRRKGL